MESKNTLIGASFLRNAYFSYGAQGFKIALGFAWVIALTRAAGLELYGMIALLTSLSGVMTNLFTFRTNEAVVKFYKRGEVENSPGLCRLAIGAGLLLDLLVAVLLFTIVRHFASAIASGLLKNPQATAGVTAYSWIILMMFLRGTGIGLLTVLEKFRIIYSFTVVEQLLKLILLIIVLQLGISLTVEKVVWIILVSGLTVTCVVLAWPLFQLFTTFKGAPIPSGELLNYARFSLSTFVSSSLKAGNQNADTVILGFLTNPASVGVYSLFRQFLGPLAIAVGPFYEQIYPRFVEAVGRNDFEVINNTIHQTTSMLAKWFALLLCTIIAVVAVYWWYMEFDFNLEYGLTFIFMAASTIILQRLWWTRGFALSYNPNISIVANILFSILVLLLVFTFTWQIGLAGAALGVLGSSIVMSVFWRAVLRRSSTQQKP